MWESLIQDKWKRNGNMNVMDKGWRRYDWDKECFCYLRRGMEGGMWGDYCWGVWTMMWKREKWMEWCIESSLRTVRELKRWSSRDVRELLSRNWWEKEIMNENDDCVVNGSEFHKEWIICWDCQTPQVQERSDCFHWEKNMEKQLKSIEIGTTSSERLLRELNNSGRRCVMWFPESSCQITREHEGKYEEAEKELR